MEDIITALIEQGPLGLIAGISLWFNWKQYNNSLGVTKDTIEALKDNVNILSNMREDIRDINQKL